MTIKMLTSLSAAQHLAQFREVRPLVHCMTNEVVQEITANVLLAAGASPAMVVSREEVESFAKISTALLINVGTPASERLPSMFAAAKAANEAGVACLRPGCCWCSPVARRDDSRLLRVKAHCGAW